MKKLRVTLTSLGVAAGILVGGYTIVNRVPVNGLSVGNPIWELKGRSFLHRLEKELP